MKKYILLVMAFIMGIAIGNIGIKTADAARTYYINYMAKDQMGNAVSASSDPKQYYRTTSATDAAACTGTCLLYDIILTSGADGAYAVVSDSVTVVGGHVLLSKFEFDGTGHQVLSKGNGDAFPIMCHHGIRIALSSVASGEEALVVYKDLD